MTINKNMLTSVVSFAREPVCFNNITSLLRLETQDQYLRHKSQQMIRGITKAEQCKRGRNNSCAGVTSL